MQAHLLEDGRPGDAFSQRQNALLRECEDSGVIIARGNEWFPAEPAGSFVRLNFSGPTPRAYPHGARVLRKTLERSIRS